MNKAVFYLLLFPIIAIFNAPCTLAGTGQIFSPSGLPQSSTQTYSPATPGNTPTVTFTTPPLPLGEAVLQGFPGASVPLSTNQQNGSVMPNNTTQHQQPPPTSTSSVQSFFQCPPATLVEEKKQSPAKSVGKFVWHVLDNLGVPLPVDKKNDLDPSLRRPYVMPLSKTSNPTIITPTPQKIPESELEGTDVSPDKDNQPLKLH